MRSLAIGVVLLSIACGRIVNAQVPTDSTARIAELEQQVARYLRLLGDWGGLTRYGSADAELGPAKPGEQRVVFIGDDITEAWSASGRFFPGKPYLNRGIARQTTPQMLVRFRQDVIALQAGGRRDSGRDERHRRHHRTGNAWHALRQPDVDDGAGAGQRHSRGPRIDPAHLRLLQEPDVDPIAGPHHGLQRVDPDVRGGERRGVPRLLLGARRRSKLQAALTSDGFLPNEAGYDVMATAGGAGDRRMRRKA